MVLFIHLHDPHASSPTRFVWNILLYIHRSPLEHVKKHHMGALMIHRPSSNNSTMRYMKNLSPKLINVEHFGFPCVSINHWDQILNKEHLHWNRFFIGAHNLPINESHGVAFEETFMIEEWAWRSRSSLSHLFHSFPSCFLVLLPKGLKCYSFTIVREIFQEWKWSIPRRMLDSTCFQLFLLVDIIIFVLFH